MIARFLQNIVVNDIEKNMEMNIDTVSYTHLDVYKRQNHICFSFTHRRPHHGSANQSQ